MLKRSRASAAKDGRLILIAIVCAGCTAEAASRIHAPPPTHVIGTLAARLPGDDSPSAAGGVALPDVDISLRDAASTVSLATTRTLLDGKFYLDAPSPGTYQVCWSAKGIGPACGAKFIVGNQEVFLGIVAARPQPGVIYGKALTADGRACWLNDSFFKIDASTRISLLDPARNVIRSGVRANVSGQYVIAGVSSAAGYFVKAECENAVGVSRVAVGTGSVAVNVTLPNHAPVIAAIGYSAGGTAITRGSPGATVAVDVDTRDADHDAVEYLWRTLDGNGSISGGNSPHQTWKLSPDPGVQTLYLIARDRKGGYAYRKIDLASGAGDLTFSGRVIDEGSLAPIPGASVNVNGETATTNAQGWFSVAVHPLSPPARYVVNITHPDYALLSQIHDREATSETYQMIRAQIATVNPATVIDVVDTRSGGPCGSPGGKVDVSTRDNTLRPLVNRAVVMRPTPTATAGKPCRHRGAHVIIPAGSLAYASGNVATSPVRMSFVTADPTRRALPGDYRAVDKNNAQVEMLSFGALYAEFRDAGGNLLNLKPGTTAEIRVPVSSAQLPFAKPTIPIWGYEEKTGFWREEGQATLKNTAEGWMYVGPTKHFSYLNMDVAGNDPAQATCVRFEIDPSLNVWTNRVMRAYVSYAGTSLKVKETSINGDQYHAIYRIPYAPPAAGPNSLRLEIRGTYSGHEYVLLNNVINTDARPKMTGTNLWPPYPYAECGTPITLVADPVTLPYYGDRDAAGRPAFLSGPFGDKFLPADGDQAATDYYNTIDPGNATNPTLSAWWGNHGFNSVDGSGGTRAAYLNYNDLGFGRDMNCKVNGADLACYVTNYGAPDQALGNADDAENRNPAKRLATVAMEYKATEPADRRVRFYVYGGGNPATAGKLKFADLDGLGPKPVPHLCTVCHGGNYDAPTKNALHSRFREFDLPSFKYSTGRSWDFAPTPNTLTNAELTAFSSLNKMVHDVTPSGTPLANLIANWYPGTLGNPNTAPVRPAVPPNWATQVNGYHDVYAKSCRTCHIARDYDVDSYITFSKYSDFQSTAYRVCFSPKVMPNAYVTYRNFWSDLTRVASYQTLTSTSTCQ